MVDKDHILPHRDIDSIPAPWGSGIGWYRLHKPCGHTLSDDDVFQHNWCPHCQKPINRAAAVRARFAARRDAFETTMSNEFMQNGPLKGEGGAE